MATERTTVHLTTAEAAALAAHIQATAAELARERARLAKARAATRGVPAPQHGRAALHASVPRRAAPAKPASGRKAAPPAKRRTITPPPAGPVAW
jgi:hypothetical protein